MEVNPLPTPPSTALSTRLKQQQLLLQREQSLRTPPISTGKAFRDVRQRRSPPTLARDGDKSSTVAGPGGIRSRKLRLRTSPNLLPSTLLPVSERKSQEDIPSWRIKKGSQEEDKFDIAPDGGSAGREGRQFAVANVGNNGRIYLRPTVRPAHQRYPQPSFVFPMTPPGTAGLDAMTENGREGAAEDAQPSDSAWTPSYAPSTPTTVQNDFRRQISSRPGHRRAVSDSTIPDTSVARESEPGGFKIVITQPGEDQRPKTLEDLDTARSPLLDVSIPSWKLGTPRFSMRGTPFIRGSSYAPTEEIRSSSASFLNRSPRLVAPDASKRLSIRMLPGFPDSRAGSLSPAGLMAPQFAHALRSTYLSTHLVIEPAMFDTLTFKPACDDRSIVRYSPATGAVTAATPPRLVAEITSPSFLDYELLSDFFLTFRAFLEPCDLLRMLISRLRWALDRNDEPGTVVRVRTFVAIRHWILNYFTDDFVVDYGLRLTFCELLNNFVDEISQGLGGRKVQLKILAELKKCWRRVCAQYWDGPEFDAGLGPDVPISPGGIAGHRNPNLDPSFWERTDFGPPQLDGFVVPKTVRDETSFYADVARAGNIDSVIIGGRPGTPDQIDEAQDELERRQTSPTSVTSIDVISCSFPGKNMRFSPPGANYPFAAHPVDPSSVYSNTDPVATTPRALVGKRVRPQPSHKRNGSLTDSLREHATATDKFFFKNADLFLTLPYAGSLVRGNLFPPSPAFVEVLPPYAPGGSSRETTVFQPQPQPLEVEKEKLPASAMSGQGMRRLLGSVRRALSTRGPGVSPTQGNFINISPIGPRGATTNRLPGTAIVPQARPSRQNGARPPVRIDLLGAEVAEDFKKAVREEAAAEAEQQQGYLSPPLAGSRVPAEMLEYSVAHMDSVLAGQSVFRPTSDMGITNGSQSIVIVDGTLPDHLTSMTGALPTVNASVEAFAESFMPNMSDPTPPNTPPGQSLGTPRRSSYVLSQVIPASLVSDPLPPFIPDMDTLGQSSSPPAGLPAETVRPAADIFRQSAKRPPLTGVRGHLRNRSSRSYRSFRSTYSARPRHHSFTSGIERQATVRSFDATTYSDKSVLDISDVPVTQPLRVLRRRPGGDLRAATNVGQLDPGLLRRSRSVGSLTTYSESVHSSFIRSPAGDLSGYVDVVTSEYSNRAETFSLGALAAPGPKRNLSLFSTHSSKPIMRPSFEAEAKKLAQIPDDMDDDGGVEAALLKLEGKYEKKSSRLSMDPLIPSPLRTAVSPREEEVEEEEEEEAKPVPATTSEEKEDHHHLHVAENSNLVSSPTLPAQEHARASFLAVPKRLRRGEDAQSFLSEESDASYSSIPLLQRGTDDGRSRMRETGEWTNRSVLKGSDDEGPTPGAFTPRDSEHPSYEFVKKTTSVERIQTEDAAPLDGADRPGTGYSFLDVESGNESDISSEMTAEIPDSDDDDEFPLPRQGTALDRLPAHPLGDDLSWPLGSRRRGSAPPSPPITLVQALRMTPENYIAVPILEEHQLNEMQLPQLTPDATPTTDAPPLGQFPLLSPLDPTGTKEALRHAPMLDIPDPVGQPTTDPSTSNLSVHLPFILAFDSDVLAQQFTLIEKDALNEIDWRELIEMRWKDAERNGTNARSWVSFLRDTDARGVEVVIARFNIMVKWAVSEVVLTQDIEERARCVIKFIHIAAHCRRYRNFATMSQITIALTSNEVSRLTKTWAMVPPSDLRTMQELEALISPTRNFYNLRAEMEGGGPDPAAVAESGCIPFVGIYTHDLLFNAQRPSEIASSPTTAPLVNFERCRISASVIKTLLRLLEASTLYDFQPIEGITERCLWMGALTDEEIRKYSQALE